ncbi:MAG: serine acetyltransferase [Bacteroidales bacterium]|nr:serine O-acetyltransferase [Eubacteriales bacterium]MDD4670868.1 serine acetyltransferase [Bacteroidales bacterium]
MLRHYTYKFGISISSKTIIGKGFYIGHFGGIVVNSATVFGDNVNISQGVCFGQSNRGEKKGCAVVGNCVYVGPGAKIVGNVHIGNNVAIGANAVVTKDIPDNAVVAGVPAKILSYNGSEGYINRKV